MGYPNTCTIVGMGYHNIFPILWIAYHNNYTIVGMGYQNKDENVWDPGIYEPGGNLLDVDNKKGF